MKRDVDNLFIKWKNSQTRQPLLVRGPRQVGKTYSIIKFAQDCFENCVTVNFEERPEFKDCFDTLDPLQVLNKISILGKTRIIPGKTLLFFDEIQECPRAIMALRYFYEKHSQLHVVGAGSLVEFAVQSENFRMPVGRIQSIYMHPLSFGEFIEALGHKNLREYLNSVTLNNHIEPAFKTELENLLRYYMILGGMPKIIDSFIKKIDIEDIKHLQSSLLKSYEDDFAKYARTSQHKYLREVFLAAPRMISRRFKYANINSDIQAKYLKEALNSLCDAKCLIKVCHSAGNGVPLEAEKNDKKFKILFLDIGLMQRAMGLDTAIMFDKKIMLINEGSLAEQMIGQELIAYENYDDKSLFCWCRDKKGSSAEVDFLIDINGVPIPVEVKSGKTGSLKSMRIFLNTHPKSKYGIRFSMQELSWYDSILSIPLYMVEQMNRLAALV